MTESEGPQLLRRRRRLRWLGAGVVALAVFGAGTVVIVARVGTSPPAPTQAAPGPAATAEVVRTDLAEQDTEDGTLGYGAERTLTGKQPGTITWLPDPGTVVERGQPVYKVDNKPVPLFYGDTPLYRNLAPGVTKGPDVQVLEENLKALGFTGFGTPDTTFTDATASAVKRWQHSLGLAETGVVTPDDVVVQPGSVRISSVSAQAGDPAGGPLMKVTGTQHAVIVKLDVSRQNIVKLGDKVSLNIISVGNTTGTVSSIGTAAVADDKSGPKIDVTITLDDQKAVGKLDSAPVSATFTTGSHPGVLAVPVGALLALAEGGMAVEVVENSGTHLVAVQTGLFARGLVEVTGDLHEGQRVVTTS
ncbi:peptidoglycan-binding protein [Amycolatopsis taiwanensis]|uniref:Peptidoglycan-binding protein n=1 Tax=Amycolatopsis taiwanensis TaxID=342230 RepID=A0A9W6QX54_9PSEU|nr:peptidoglycan-binding protein [Amycolatopsis taiwanensis]GLY64530.1 peptidoglycan-binding protein [Amycolatopsis taiwanensis]